MARRSSSLGATRPLQATAARQRSGRQFVGADDAVAVLLEKPHCAAQHLVVAARDDLLDVLPVAQERIGAEQR